MATSLDLPPRWVAPQKMHGGNEVQPGDVDALLYYYGNQAVNDLAAELMGRVKAL